MDTITITKAAAVLAAVAWTIKSVAIGFAGGLDKSPLESPLFIVGLVALLVAAVAFALSLTARHGILVRIAAVLAAVVIPALVAAGVHAAVQALVSSDHWVWEEVNLWVLAVGMLGLAFSRTRE